MNTSESLRPLTSDELALLRWMVDHGSEELRAFAPQLEGIRATRWCDCGCPSIRLEVTEGTPLEIDNRGAVVGDFAGKTHGGESVGVLLFQRAGKLELLEVYSIDGHIRGESQEFGLPMLYSLEPLMWEPVPGMPNVRRQIKSPESPA